MRMKFHVLVVAVILWKACVSYVGYDTDGQAAAADVVWNLDSLVLWKDDVPVGKVLSELLELSRADQLVKHPAQFWNDPMYSHLNFSEKKNRRAGHYFKIRNN